MTNLPCGPQKEKSEKSYIYYMTTSNNMKHKNKDYNFSDIKYFESSDLKLYKLVIVLK